MGPATKAKIVELYRRNWGSQDIATAVGATTKQVGRVLRDAGYHRKPGPRTTGNIKIDYAMMNRPYEKCPECGAKVQMPCLECQVLNAQRSTAARR